jgi:hypothetical protein
MGESQDEKRAASNQALFREINGRVEALNEAFVDKTVPYATWTCECARLDCIERMQMTIDEYEALRQTPTRFAVMPNEQHIFPNIERVVERTDRYWVVEKVGTAAAVAAQLASKD